MPPTQTGRRPQEKLYQEPTFAQYPYAHEVGFVGIDTYTEASRLAPGLYQQADNVLSIGGTPVSRPGFLGMFSTALSGGPVYELTEYEKEDGTFELVFAQNSKLWFATAGSPSAPTELKNGAVGLSGGTSFAFPSGGAPVRMTRYGKFLYGCDGVHDLFRVNLEAGTAGYYTGLTAPTTAPTVTLTNTILDPCNDATVWAGFPAPSGGSANLILTNSFESGTSAPFGRLFPITDWANIGAGTADAASNGNTGGNEVAFDGVYALLLDDPRDTTAQIVGTGGSGAVPTLDFNSIQTGLPTSAAARVYSVLGYAHCADNSGNAAIQVSVLALNSSGGSYAGTTDGVIATSTTIVKQPYNGNNDAWGQFQTAVSFDGLAVDPEAVALQFQAGAQNVPGNASTYVDLVSLIAPVMTLVVTLGNGAIGDCLNVTLTDPTMNGPSGPAATLVGGQWIRRAFSSAVDLSQSDIIATAIDLPTYAVNAAGTMPRFRFGFMASGDTAISWSNDCTYSADGKYISADCTTVDVATRQACVAFFIQIEDDLPLLQQGQLVFSFGPLIAGGNLLVGGSYTYRFDEMQTVTKSVSVFDVIESSSSPLSVAVTPDVVHAETAVTLPAQTNGSADTWSIFRGGGEFIDGFWRLISDVPIAAPSLGNPAAPSSPTADYLDPLGNWNWDHSLALYVGVANTTWTYDPATRIFSDNVPDSDLLLADVYEVNRDNWPAGISQICVNNARLFGSIGNEVYASWLLTVDAESALYTSINSDPLDPELSNKGDRFVLGSGAESDVVEALVPIATSIVALRSNTVTHIEGYDPTNFANVDRYHAAGVGCIAPRTAVSDEIGGTMMWLAPSGVKGYDSDKPVVASRQLEGLLPLNIPISVLSGAAAVVHDLRRYLFVPNSPSDNGNSNLFVYDTRQEGWTRWLGIQVASACSTGDNIYFGGADGQIYSLGGSVDKATPSSAGVAIPIALTTRAFGGDVPEYIKQGTRLHFSVETQEDAVNLTLGVLASNYPSIQWNKNYLSRADGGETDEKVRVSAGVRGVHLTLSLSANVTQEFRMRAIGLETVIGQRR